MLVRFREFATRGADTSAIIISISLRRDRAVWRLSGTSFTAIDLVRGLYLCRRISHIDTRFSLPNLHRAHDARNHWPIGGEHPLAPRGAIDKRARARARAARRYNRSPLRGWL